jgi:hypothetical protein
MSENHSAIGTIEDNRKSTKRIVTSAIEGMSVSEVRKCLDLMRKQWREKDETTPFYICETFNDNITMDKFAFQFVMGHHFKRHNKQMLKSDKTDVRRNHKARASSGGDDCSADGGDGDH